MSVPPSAGFTSWKVSMYFVLERAAGRSPAGTAARMDLGIYDIEVSRDRGRGRVNEVVAAPGKLQAGGAPARPAMRIAIERTIGGPCRLAVGLEPAMRGDRA